MRRTWFQVALVAVAVSAVGLVAGCKGTVANVASELSGVQATGAKVGQKGKIRLTFTGPVPADVDVTLASLTSTLANVPAHVTVPQGALSADFDYDGLAIGQGVITATAGVISKTTTLNVIDDFRIVNGSGSVTLEVGALGSPTFSLNAVPPQPVDIALTVADGSIVAVPSTVTVSPFSSYQYLYLTGKAPGSTQITATLAGSTSNLNVKVVDHARIRYFNTSNTVETGATGTISVGLDATVAQTTTVAVTSSDASIAAVPTMLIVPAGTTGSPNLYFPVTGVGTTQLTATLGDSVLGATITALSKAQLSNVSVSGTLQTGLTGQLSVNVNTAVAMPRVITLTSSDPSVLPVPASVTIDINNSSASAFVTPLKNGDVEITATFDGLTVHTAAHIGSGGGTNPLYLYTPTPIAVGGFANLQVYTYTYGYPVTLTSSDPTVIAVPSTLQVNYGVTLAINPLKAGTTTISATANGMTQFIDVRVVDLVGISQMPANVTVAVGASASTYLYLSAVPPIGTAVTFSSSNPTVLAAPAPVKPSDGNTYVQIPLKGLSSGTSLLTATVGGISRTMVVYVGASTGNQPFLSSSNIQSSQLEVGASTTVNVNLNTQTQVDLPVTVTFSTPGVVSIPGAVPTIPAGIDYVVVPVTAVGAGTTTGTVTVDGRSTTFSVTVVASPTFNLSGTTTFAVGTESLIQLGCDSTLKANDVFTITSSNPSAVTVTTSTATLGPGTSSGTVTFGAKGVAAGTSTITAAIGGVTKGTVILTVTP